MRTAIASLLIIMSLTTLPSFAESKVLKGKIKYAGVRDAMRKADKQPKPDWIEGEVYTHAGMYVFGRSFRTKSPKKLHNFRLPKNKVSSRVSLDASVTKYWNGYVPPGKCYVTFIPIQSNDGKEHFKFIHADPHGPFGYLEYIDTVKNAYPGEENAKEGHAMYKCWLGVDQNPEGADLPSPITQTDAPRADASQSSSDSNPADASTSASATAKKQQVSANSSESKSESPK